MNSALVWPKAPVSVKQLIDTAADYFSQAELFFGHGTDNPWDESLWLILHALGWTWSDSDEVLDRTLDQAQADRAISLLERRIDERVPAAYITGSTLFAGLEFIVTPDVLVPRSPIAELIQQEFQPWLPEPPHRVLDLCTGSGCIGIACAAVFSQAEVVCSDISAPALVVAERNIQLHQLQHRVSAVSSDVFEHIRGTFDLIVSNPPYVDAADMAAMPEEYRREPELGLAAGDDGLLICRKILRDAARFLNPKGVLIVEVGNSWPALEQAYPDVPFTWIEFAYGGDGVFVFTADELAHYAPIFQGDDIIDANK